MCLAFVVLYDLYCPVLYISIKQHKAVRHYKVFVYIFHKLLHSLERIKLQTKSSTLFEVEFRREMYLSTWKFEGSELHPEGLGN